MVSGMSNVAPSAATGLVSPGTVRLAAALTVQMGVAIARAHWGKGFWNSKGGIEFPFTLGAIVSPPDAVAATAIAQRLAVPRRIVSILEGESLLNDATALTIYRAAVGAAVAAACSPRSSRLSANPLSSPTTG
jgi:NhaP-type Na+/H+ or K+/H+ antiporter